MPEPRLKVLLIEKDPADAERVRSLLLRDGGLGFELHHVETLLPGLDRLAKGDIDVVLMDSAQSDGHGLDAIPALRMHAPAAPIVVLSAVENDAFAIRAVQIGAQDCLGKKTLDAESLCRSLRYAVVRQKSQPAAAEAETDGPAIRVVGCMGAKGGVGTSTVACHAGLELKRLTGQRVLLADANLNGGSIGFLTRAESSYTILDAANDLLRLDQSLWDRVVSAGPEDLEVLPLSAPICEDEPVRADRIRCVLRFWRSLYPWTVLDLGRLNSFSAGLLTDITDLLLVTALDVAAVTEARRVVDRLAELGYESRRVTLIVNKVPKLDWSAAREVAKILGIPASAIIPEGSTDLSDSRNGMRSHFGPLITSLAGLREDRAPWKRFPFLPGFFGRNRQLKIA
ncbi:MAG: response regulator [Bryobacteraceae bacterium]